MSKLRRARKRGKYHELSFLRYLKKFGWRYNTGKLFDDYAFQYPPFNYAGRRIPVSGPMFGWCDGVATKLVEDKLHIIFFQIKPRSRKDFTYFEKRQLVSLYMLEELFTFPHNIIHKVLVGRLKRRWVMHEVTNEDILFLDELTKKHGRPSLFRLNRNAKSTFNPKLDS